MTSSTRIPAILLLLTGATSGVAAAQWNDSGPFMWTADRVGVGTVPHPDAQLHIYNAETFPVVLAESDIPGAGFPFSTAIQGVCRQSGVGVHGSCTATYGGSIGVLGEGKTGVFARGEGENGKALHAIGQSNTGTNYGVWGETNSPDGFSGYFRGGTFFVLGKYAGIGRSQPVNSTEAFGVHKPTTGWGGMYVSTWSGGQPYYGYSHDGTALAYHYYNPGDSQWRLHNGGVRLAVNKNGRVGINTIQPGFTLHVNGSAGKPGGGSWSSASDLRLKQDVRELDGALDRLLTLRGVTFEYRDPEAIHELPGRRLGVIAQEVERVFPDWVDEHEDGFKRVTFRGFEAVAVEAIRELEQRRQRETAVLRQENTRLKGAVDDLHGRLASIEATLAAAGLAGEPGE